MKGIRRTTGSGRKPKAGGGEQKRRKRSKQIEGEAERERERKRGSRGSTLRTSAIDRSIGGGSDGKKAEVGSERIDQRRRGEMLRACKPRALYAERRSNRGRGSDRAQDLYTESRSLLCSTCSPLHVSLSSLSSLSFFLSLFLQIRN
jgi:hypothetical protein